jgi:hypothetical protein
VLDQGVGGVVQVNHPDVVSAALALLAHLNEGTLQAAG